MRYEWFFAMAGFLWIYSFAAKKIEARLLRGSRKYRQYIQISWMWIVVGCIFIIFQVPYLMIWIKRETMGPGFFVWFCFHGGFAIMTGSIIIGLLRTISEVNKLRRRTGGE